MTEPMRYDHIEQLSTREPVGAVLTVGTKGPSGAPINTDRFYVKVPQEDANRIRVNHPQFVSYNEAGEKNPADLVKRQTIRGNLVHATRAEAWNHHLRAQVLGPAWKPFPKSHPSGRPICSGDGLKATRLYAIGEHGEEDWREIDCPHDKCAFRQGDKKACKPFGRLFFRPRWPEGSKFPTPLMKLTTLAWNNVSAFLGFFEYIEAQARNLGLASYSLYGLPFSISLHRKKVPQRERAFPILIPTPEADLIEFFLRQREQIQTIGMGSVALALPVGNLSPEETAPEVVDADRRSVTMTAPGKPSNAQPELEIEGEVVTEAPEPPTEPEHYSDRLSADALKRIRSMAGAAGISDSALEQMAGGRLEDAPAAAETEILSTIKRNTRTRK